MTQYGEGVLDIMVLAATKEPGFIRYLEFEGKGGKTPESMAQCLGMGRPEAMVVFQVFIGKGLAVIESPGYKAPHRLYAPQHAPSQRKKELFQSVSEGPKIRSWIEPSVIDPVLAKRREIQTQNQLLYGRRTTGKSWGQSA
jgi:hypothetical protein